MPGFDVDTIMLKTAMKQLTMLQAFIEQWIVRTLREVPGMSRDQRKAFGGFPAAVDLANTHEELRATVVERYAALAIEIGRTAAATRQIIENYQTREDRSRASAQDVLRKFDDVANVPVAPSAAHLPPPPQGESGAAIASVVAEHGGQPMSDPSLTAGRAEPPPTAAVPKGLEGLLTPGAGRE